MDRYKLTQLETEARAREASWSFSNEAREKLIAKRLGKAIVLLLGAGITAAVTVGSTDVPGPKAPAAISKNVEKSSGAINKHKAVTKKHPIVQPKPEAIHDMDIRTYEAIKKVHLTKQGYIDFLNNIDRSYLPVAHHFKAFRTREVNIPHRRTQTFVLHYTTLYYNGEGRSTAIPIGNIDIYQFLESINNRGDKPGETNPNDGCCGINWLIDRNGKAYQLAHKSDKLAQALGFNGWVTGAEIEASTQYRISTEQYEAVAYLAIADTRAEGLLGHHPLSEIIQGHEEMDKRLFGPGRKPDFDTPEAAMLRGKIGSFLKTDPIIYSIDPLLS